MSGIDEHIPDVPVCPTCGERPSFWILYPCKEQTGEFGFYWLHSDNYLERDPDSDKLVSMTVTGGKRTTLDEIMRVVCQQRRGSGHSFASEHPTFQEVLKLARKLER